MEKVVIGLIVLAIILQSSAISDSHWTTMKLPKSDLLDEGDMYFGMWKGCLKIQDQEKCETIQLDSLKSEQKTALSFVRIVSILSVLLLAGALICMFVNKKLVVGMLLTSILLSISAAVGWSTNKDLCPPDVKYGRSFYMNVLGYVVAIAGLLVLRGVKDVKDIRSLFAFLKL